MKPRSFSSVREGTIVGITVITMMIFFVSALFPQAEAITVGISPIMDVDRKQPADSVIAGLTTELSRYKFIRLVERSKMKEMLDEIKLSQSDLVDEASAVKLGKLHGVQVMVFGSVHAGKITARTVDLGTGHVITAAAVDGMPQLETLARQLAGGLESQLMRENLKTMRNDNPDLGLKFWIEKNATKGGRGLTVNPAQKGGLKIGDTVVFNFQAQADGFLTIVDIQPGGDVVVLFPNQLVPDNRVQAGRQYAIPGKDDGFELTVSRPAGLDTVVAFFTTRKVDWLDHQKLAGEGFWSVKETEKGAASRGFKVTATGLKKSEWTSAVLEVEVGE